MRTVLLLFATLLIVSTGFLLIEGSSSAGPAETENFSSPINHVLGDESFVETYGSIDTDADEVTRIRTHLAYVESMLRDKDTGHLSPDQQAAREAHLDELMAYKEAGKFPQNTERPGERTPIFIDQDDRLCAVGHLIAESAGFEAAEKINDRFKFDLIQDIPPEYLRGWAQKAGFTLQELAKIQPMYCGEGGMRGGIGCIEPEQQKLHPHIEIAGMTANASLAVTNGFLLASERNSPVVAGLGLVSSGAGLGMGLSSRANYATSDLLFAGASMLFSGWHLLESLNIKPFSSDESSATRAEHASERSGSDLRVEPTMVPSGAGNNDYNMGLRVALSF